MPPIEPEAIEPESDLPSCIWGRIVVGMLGAPGVPPG